MRRSSARLSRGHCAACDGHASRAKGIVETRGCQSTARRKTCGFGADEVNMEYFWIELRLQRGAEYIDMRRKNNARRSASFWVSCILFQYCMSPYIAQRQQRKTVGLGSAEGRVVCFGSNSDCNAAQSMSICAGKTMFAGTLVFWFLVCPSNMSP